MSKGESFIVIKSYQYSVERVTGLRQKIYSTIKGK